MYDCLRCGKYPRRYWYKRVCCLACRTIIGQDIALNTHRARQATTLELLDWLLRQHFQQIGLVSAA